MPLAVGTVVKLLPRFYSENESGICIIISIETFVGTGWMAYDYIAMNSSGRMIRITEGCVDEVYSMTMSSTLQTSGSLE